MSQLNERLRRALETALRGYVDDAAANCPGCVRIPARILLPGDPDSSDELVRCERCGKEQRPCTIRIDVPGCGGPLVAMD